MVVRKRAGMKYALASLAACVVVGTASIALGASITGISVTNVSPDGTVAVTATTDFSAGDQVTIKVDDYTSNVTDGSNIAYIDQVDAAGNVDFSFKLRNVDTGVTNLSDLDKVYRLSIGGTGINAPTVQALFKPRDKVAAGLWVTGPESVSKTPVDATFVAKVVDSKGSYLSDASVDWAFSADFAETSNNGLTISDGALSGTYTGAESSITVYARIHDNTALAASKTIKIVDGTPVVLPKEDITNPASGSEILKNDSSAAIPLAERPSGAFVSTSSVVKNSAVSVSLPTIAGGAYDITISKQGAEDEHFTSNTFDWTPADSGKYCIKIDVKGAGDDVQDTKIIYVGVANSTEDIVNRATIVANNIALTGTEAGSTQLTVEVSGVASTANAKYKYWLLPTSVPVDTEGYNPATDKSKWIQLSDDFITENSLIFAKPPAGDYRIAVYVKTDYSADYIDAYRIITIRVASDGSVTRPIN